MKRCNSYTKKQEDWLKENYCKYSLKEATIKFNETFNQSRTMCAIQRITTVLGVKSKIRFSDAEIKFLQDNAYSLTNKELYEEFTKHFKQTKTFTQIKEVLKKRLKIKRDKEIISRAIHNKMSDKFPIGYIAKSTILYIKVKNDVNNTKKNYIPYHYYVLEQNGIKVKDDQVVKFKDGNRYNCNLDNLLVISKPTFAYMNRNNLWNKGEITKTALKIGELLDEIREKEGEKDGY